MALFPKIQSPCPYKNNLASVMDGDMCRMCKRQVFDLNAMSDGERVTFMKGCSGEVCVTYRIPVRPVLAAAMIAAAAIAAPSAALACSDATDEIVVETGGIKDPGHVEYIDHAADRSVPELPVVYEDKPAAPQSAAGSGENTPPAPTRARGGV